MSGPEPTQLLTVTNRVAPEDRTQDEVYEFTFDGQRRTFGRDHAACDIVIWSAHNGTDLARVAGEIWRWGDELWVRNLSTTHEVGLTLPDQPPEQPLRRRRDETSRGAACSIPAPVASLTAPGGCLLEVHQVQQPLEQTFRYGLESPTVAVVPEVPEEFRALAAALCEPLLLGARLPAAHSEVMTRLNHQSLKALRRQIDRLCALYTSASPELAVRVAQRKERQEAALAPAPPPVRRGGVYRFDDAPDQASPPAPARSRSLSLPDYYEVAHLLVRHYRVTREDLALLPPRETSE